MYSSPPGNTSDRSIELVERFKKMFDPVVEVTESVQVKIALDVAVRMGNIACNPEMWEKVMTAIPSPYLGLSCDPSHWLWMMITPVEDVIRDYAGKWFYADVKDCEISTRMLYRQGIIGNWWWQYRLPGRGQLNWGTIIGALLGIVLILLNKIKNDQLIPFGSFLSITTILILIISLFFPLLKD